MPEEVEAELIEDFLVIWDPKKGSNLFKCGFYGKPLGISKPRNLEFDVPLILDLMEGLYLVEKNFIHITEGPNKKEISFRALKNKAKRACDDFDAKYMVYRDLREQGLVVTPGIKYGCDFAVYKDGPGIDHAPYMISVKNRKDNITATEIVKNGRLATTVRKRFIIAVPELERNTIEYLIFKWYKA